MVNLTAYSANIEVSNTSTITRLRDSSEIYRLLFSGLVILILFCKLIWSAPMCRQFSGSVLTAKGRKNVTRSSKTPLGLLNFAATAFSRIIGPTTTKLAVHAAGTRTQGCRDWGENHGTEISKELRHSRSATKTKDLSQSIQCSYQHVDAKPLCCHILDSSPWNCLLDFEIKLPECFLADVAVRWWRFCCGGDHCGCRNRESRI